MNRFVLVLFFAALQTATAATVWDETASGDLSSDPAAPTAITLAIGDNTISGSVNNADDVRDYVTFSIGAGQQLDALNLLSYEDLNVGGNGNRGFHSLNTGSTSFIPGGGTADNFLGGDHLDWEPSGTDLLPSLTSGVAGTGFSIPLGEGTYTYLVQQTGPQLTGYSVGFSVSAVPEPTAGMLGFAAAGALLFVRRRRS